MMKKVNHSSKSKEYFEGKKEEMINLNKKFDTLEAVLKAFKVTRESANELTEESNWISMTYLKNIFF